MLQPKRGQAWRSGKLTLTADEITRLGQEYLAECEVSKRNPTFEGLANKFGISSSTLKAWFENKDGKWPEASDALKKVLDCITDDLQQGKDSMSIFRLKQKHYGGYIDKVETEQSGNLTITVKGAKGVSWGK